ncbi:hypothetical protein BASA61_000648 [Batrachochytrium salamandrivorans]|nr:hypothetical protein BASA61_000648 [Batrachochytrium salamandrivorans]
MPGRSPSKRGVGIQFGPDVTEAFLKLNNLDLLIRSHEVKNGGYEVAHNGKCIRSLVHPTIVTLPEIWALIFTSLPISSSSIISSRLCHIHPLGP